MNAGDDGSRYTSQTDCTLCADRNGAGALCNRGLHSRLLIPGSQNRSRKHARQAEWVVVSVVSAGGCDGE
jgi:hypothetical protein